MFVIPYPAIDPVLVEFGPFAIRWYALAYVFGLLLGWRYARSLSRKFTGVATADDFDDFLVWATLGVVLGGRLGYVLFYKPEYYLENPLAALEIWRGGMAFHGGVIGLAVACLLFCRHRKIPTLRFGDILCCVAPIGLFFGRLANFINGELVGRTATVPWAMIFPGYGPEPRHPSQLYEATMEGILLFVVLGLLARSSLVRSRPGLLCGIFFAGYGLLRSIGELFRQPDAHLGFLYGGLTMGQLLSAPMIILGIALIAMALRRKAVDTCPTSSPS